MTVALLGFGVVGSGVYEILNNIPQYNVKRILIRNPQKLSMNCMTLDFCDIVNDKDIDIVVEAIGGLHPAKEYILACLNAKKHVVTANKAVVAAFFKEFVDAANANGVKFLVEATSGGGIPWIKNLQRAGRIDKINKVYGIMNGTSNYILSSMENRKIEFTDALKEAQQLGYAESDPSADIDGDDVCNKCAISASIAFRYPINICDIQYSGIRNISKFDIEVLSKEGYCVKLFAFAIRQSDCFDAVAEPVILNKNTIEANVGQNYNITCLYGDTIGEIKLFGQGAGSLPTANAIVQDIIDINTDNSFDIIFDNNIKKADIIKGRYYIRIPSNTFGWREIIGKWVDVQQPVENNIIIITKEISPILIHKLLDSCNTPIFAARFFK